LLSTEYSSIFAIQPGRLTPEELPPESSLERAGGAFYCQRMKQISSLLVAFVFLAVPALRAQDAAVEERLNKLNGLVQDLVEDKTNQKKQLESLAKELESLREQQNHPNTAYAMQQDLQRLAEKIQEIDRKREADKELILKKIEELAKTLVVPSKKHAVAAPPPATGAADTPATPEKGFEHVIQSGDTLSTIVAAYREQKIKVTLDQILKANPGLVPEKMKVGQKIFIPAPKP
jgi:LysM repeat protein